MAVFQFAPGLKASLQRTEGETRMFSCFSLCLILETLVTVQYESREGETRKEARKEEWPGDITKFIFRVVMVGVFFYEGLFGDEKTDPAETEKPEKSVFEFFWELFVCVTNHTSEMGVFWSVREPQL